MGHHKFCMYCSMYNIQWGTTSSVCTVVCTVYNGTPQVVEASLKVDHSVYVSWCCGVLLSNVLLQVITSPAPLPACHNITCL